MKNTPKRLATLFSLAVLLGTSSIASAAELGLNLYGFSYHTDRDDLNERNYGVGLRYTVNENIFIEGGQFKDSMSDRSRYAGAAYQLRFGVIGAGVGAFVMTRPSYRDNDPFLSALPIITLTTGPITTNLIYIPKGEKFKLEETFFIFWTVRLTDR